MSWLADIFRDTFPEPDPAYDPQAVIDCEHALKLIADAHPEYRDTVQEAVHHLTSMWCRLAQIRQAVK